MATEKTSIQGGPSPSLFPGQPAHPAAFGTNMQDPNLFGGPAPGDLPPPYPTTFPPPTAYGPGVPGVSGVATNPQSGSGYGANPSSSPYYPPGQGFNDNFNR